MNLETKTIKGTTYHYCDFHKAWGKHKTEECRLKQIKESNVSKQLEASMAMSSLNAMRIQDIQDGSDSE